MKTFEELLEQLNVLNKNVENIINKLTYTDYCKKIPSFEFWQKEQDFLEKLNCDNPYSEWQDYKLMNNIPDDEQYYEMLEKYHLKWLKNNLIC